MKYALIIGNNRYDDAKLAQLKTPAADSKALANILKDRTIGSFDEVASLVNQTETQVRRTISSFLANKKPDDLVLLYFSGHGVLDDRGRLYLALKDTQVDLLKATSIPSSFVADEMDSCRSKRQILILDCCHSGAFARGAKGGPKAITETTFEGSGFGRVVLTASDSTQYALEGDQVIKQSELSLFTHFLLEGLKTGEADANNDGHISLDEWYDYTYAKVISETPRQVPHKWSYNQQGDLIIARNPYVKKKVAELPYELIHALESSFVGIRESAVAELGNYLHSRDPAMVELAISYLEKMKRDDSRRISSLAERLLSEYDEARTPGSEMAASKSDAVKPEPAGPNAVPRRSSRLESAIATAQPDSGRERAHKDLFFIFLSTALILFVLLIFSAGLELTSAVSIFKVLHGIANILVGISFFLKKDVPRNFGFIALALFSLLFGIMIQFESFGFSIQQSWYSLPALLALLAGVFFVSQKETRQDLAFLMLSGYLISLSAALITIDTSAIDAIFTGISALFGLMAAIFFFRDK